MNHIILMGAGPLGIKVADFIMARPNLALVGIVDLNPDLAGKTAAEIIDGAPGDLTISTTLDEAIAKSTAQPDAVVITTVSSVQKILPSIREIAGRKLHMVTTCEELSYPWRRHPDEAAEIDRICQENGVSCLGVGVNPGFLMDYLPSVFSAIHQRVEHILVERVQDASVRRIPFQQKIGAGLSLSEFEAKRRKGTLRHVGLPESLDMVAAAMNWEITDSSESLNPVLATADIDQGYKAIKQGEPSGVEQIATGMVDDREVIRLHFRAAVGEEASYDRIVISGNPGAEIIIKGGVNGDIATSAITANSIRAAIHAKPGLRTMLDVGVPSWFGGSERS